MKKNSIGTKPPKRQKRKKNRQIFLISLVFIVLFAGMSYYIVNYAMTHRQELISNSYNGRQKILAARNMRGTIFDRNNVILASSSMKDEKTEVRNYPYGNMFSHIVGYAVNGGMGVEAMTNFYLINSNAPISEKAKLDAAGAKYPGDNVYTTLDYELQKVAYDAMGIYKGAVIVTDPKTGEILALVSKPDFDPALIEQNWKDYLEDKDSGVLVNRVTQGLYPPGSTFKIITAYEYIREHPEDYSSYSYNCKGSITRGEDTVRCYHGSVHGTLSFKKSFAKSCNSSFANIGLTLDRDEFGKTLNRFLFNQKLPTDLTTSVSRLEVNSETEDSDMIQIAIGQGKANITPLQLNMITSAIANDGMMMKPHVLSGVKNSHGTSIKAWKSEAYGRIMSESDAAIMQGLMENVVQEGTATGLREREYIAAGKTGSAEYGTVKGESHAWFTGFAGMPDENGEMTKPDICVTIIIEEAGSGGEYAVPVARRIFDAYYGVEGR